MEPLLKRGDRIIVAPASAQRLVVGDLVLAEIDGRKVCHRLVGLRSQAQGPALLLLRGDAAFSEPDAVAPSACFGRVFAIIKPGGLVSMDTASSRLLSKIAIYAFPPLMSLRRILARLLGR